jgi:methyl-accepting chemotaxis protein
MKDRDNALISAIFTEQFTSIADSMNGSHLCLVKSHQSWMARFYAAIANEEQLDVATISKDNECELGRWLHSDFVRPYASHLPRYHTCVEKHAMFHVEAGKVAELINVRDYETAQQLLNHASNFSRSSAALLATIFPGSFDPLIDGHLYLVASHSHWKAQLRIAISNKSRLNVATISKNNHCVLGRWLHSDQAHLYIGHIQSHYECILAHTLFHIEAGNVAEHINASRYDDALQLMEHKSDFGQKSVALVSAITRLKIKTAAPTKQVTSVKPIADSCALVFA